MSFWIALGITLFVLTILALMVVCSGFNWNDDERRAEAEGVGNAGGQGSELNGTARPWLDDSVSAQDDDRQGKALGTDGGGPH